MLAPTEDEIPPSLSTQPLLEARDLWFSYGRMPVLRGVSLTVGPGEIVMVLGRSGSGKTTLLKVLQGLLPPAQGSILLSGRRRSAPAGRTAYIPQTLGLVRNLTALENTLTGALTRTSFARSMVRIFPAQIVEEAKQTLVSLGLAPKVSEAVFNLSGGERQRVAIARALMQKPRLILADEFVSQLDHHTAREILDLMHTVARDGVGILVTTHEIDVVMSHADRIMIMKDGKIVHDEPPAEISAGDLADLMK